MAEQSFGEFLHSVRTRTKGTQLAKAAGISYVYLLDLEKGARPVPSNAVLMALADHLPFQQGEREAFFDLAAIEKGEIPLDIACYINGEQELIDIIRQIKKVAPTIECWRALRDSIMLNNGGISDET